MSRRLQVYSGAERVGELTCGADDLYAFAYDAGWLAGRSPVPLSLSLPLQRDPFPPAAVKAFFANLLPEGQLRDHFAGKFKLSPDDDFGLLAALGGDCAGALSLHHKGAEPAPGHQAARYRPLSEEDLGNLLDEAFIMDPSFLDGEERTRLSLAGVQDKLPVAVRDGVVSLPLDGSPSTHILKPPNPRFPALVENEGFCMTLARAMGLAVPAASLRRVRGSEFVYLVERYDRRVGKDGGITRIHQEDFCQATGTSYRLKYEERGGPGLRLCFQVVGHCRNPLTEKIRLIELTVFNYLLGNSDCHAKNISLLYDRGLNPSLAPFYDLVCTGVYRLSRTLAMAIGGVYDPRDVDGLAWSGFAEQAGLRSPGPVLETLSRMAESIPAKARETARGMVELYGDSPVYGQIVDFIEQRAATVLRQQDSARLSRRR